MERKIHRTAWPLLAAALALGGRRRWAAFHGNYGMPMQQEQRELIPPERDERFVRWIPVVVPLLAVLILALVLLIEANVL